MCGASFFLTNNPEQLVHYSLVSWGEKRLRTAICIIFTDISSFARLNSTDFHLIFHSQYSDFTCIRQIEGALIFAPVVPQEDLVNTHIVLGDLEFEVRAALVSLRQR